MYACKNLQIMVRIRGLGRVLGRVIGRVMGREDRYSDDVLQRRRSTPSARKQREAAPVAEDAPDVADVTEDVTWLTWLKMYSNMLKKQLMILRGFQVGRVTHQCWLPMATMLQSLYVMERYL